jgi:acetyl-CoA carboxylase biotin carboxyl carrier protein
VNLRPQDVRVLVSAFEASDWDELTLTVAGGTVQLSKTGRPPAPVLDADSVPPGAAVAAVPVLPSMVDVPEGPGTTRPAAAATGGQVVAPASGLQRDFATLHAITAPSVGVLWHSPEPGAPPFVQVGQRVEATDPVCIVEVMKLFNHVQAGVSGTIRSVEVDNAAMVEHGQTLFLVELEP